MHGYLELDIVYLAGDVPKPDDVSRGINSPYKSGGGQKPPFLDDCNFMATLVAYVFGIKHDIDIRSSVLTTTRGLLHRPKCLELWSTNGFNLDRHLYAPNVNSAFYIKWEPRNFNID